MKTKKIAISNTDFKDRIKSIMANADAQVFLAVKKTNPAIVRGKNDRGYYPPKKS